MKKMVKQDINPFRSTWPLFFLVTFGILVVSYYFYMQTDQPTSGSVIGIIYGVLALGTIIFLAFYRIRKSYFGFRMGSLHAWLQAHIYASILSVVLVYMHTGLKFSGPFSIALQVAFLTVFISGIIGSIIYAVIPLSLSKYGKEILSDEDILDTFQKCLDDSQKLVEKASDDFREVYEKQIEPRISNFSTKWKYLLTEETQIINSAEQKFEELKSLVPANEVYDLKILGTMYIERERLAFKQAKLKVLHGWLMLHVPLTAAMLTALTFHVLSMVYF